MVTLTYLEEAHQAIEMIKERMEERKQVIAQRSTSNALKQEQFALDLARAKQVSEPVRVEETPVETIKVVEKVDKPEFIAPEPKSLEVMEVEPPKPVPSPTPVKRVSLRDFMMQKKQESSQTLDRPDDISRASTPMDTDIRSVVSSPITREATPSSPPVMEISGSIPLSDPLDSMQSLESDRMTSPSPSIAEKLDSSVFKSPLAETPRRRESLLSLDTPHVAKSPVERRPSMTDSQFERRTSMTDSKVDSPGPERNSQYPYDPERRPLFEDDLGRPTPNRYRLDDRRRPSSPPRGPYQRDPRFEYRRPSFDRPDPTTPQSDRPLFNDTPRGDRPPFNDTPRGDRPPFNDTPRGDRPPFNDAPRGDRPPMDRLNDTPRYPNRPPRFNDGPRQERFGDRPDRPPMDRFDRPPFDSPRPPMDRFGDRTRPPMDRFNGPRPPMDRFNGPRPPMDRYNGPRPPMDRFNEGPRQDRFGDRQDRPPFDAQRQDRFVERQDRPPFGDRPDRPPERFGERYPPNHDRFRDRPFHDRPYAPPDRFNARPPGRFPPNNERFNDNRPERRNSFEPRKPIASKPNERR